MEPIPPAVEVRSRNHCTAREVPRRTHSLGLEMLCEFQVTIFWNRLKQVITIFLKNEKSSDNDP